MCKVNRKFLITALVLSLTLMLAGTLVFAGYHITITIDGREIESDVAPQLLDGRTLVPIRVITEYFGADVAWVQETMSVEITSPPQRFLDAYTEKEMYIKQASEVLPMFNAGTAVVLDVRGDDLRARSLIIDSIHIPMPQLLDRLDELPRDKAIAVYCAKNINAAYAVAILNMQGYEAYLLENGINAWISAGGKTMFYTR